MGWSIGEEVSARISKDDGDMGIVEKEIGDKEGGDSVLVWMICVWIGESKGIFEWIGCRIMEMKLWLSGTSRCW